jgi:hypothetical protein
MMGAPSFVDEVQLDELSLKLEVKAKEQNFFKKIDIE